MSKQRFATSNYELDRALSKGRNKKVIGLMRYELSGDFAALKPKTNSYLTDSNDESKKAKGKKSVS